LGCLAVVDSMGDKILQRFVVALLSVLELPSRVTLFPPPILQAKD
jgi:hypothetical protein